MKFKMLNAALILTSVVAYLEWGGNNSMFLLSAEYEIFVKLFTAPSTVLHPFTVIPLVGQLLLLITLFQKQPSRVLTYIGMSCIALLLLFIFVIGIMSLNLKILGSALPFLVMCLLTVIANRKSGRGMPVVSSV